MMLNYDDTSLALRNMSYLPSDKSSKPMPEDGISPKYMADGKPTVLVFGQDREIRFLLRTIVELWNYEYAEAETVEEAVCIATQKKPALVLMDMKITFPESFAEMRSMQKIDLLKDSPFILLSGHVQSDVRLSALAAGAADYFVKPINLDLLEETMKLRIAESDRIKHGT